MKPALPDQSELGQNSDYCPYYNPDKLFPIPRKTKRDEIGIPAELPFFGFDRWNHYEVSWLNEWGKPIVALAEIVYGCDSLNIIESKSMKLYFNSFNNTVFKDVKTLQETIKKDIEARIFSPVMVNIFSLPSSIEKMLFSSMPGICLDILDVVCTDYQVNPAFLILEDETVEEMVFSNLLKSNCLVTQQPDWGSVQISYKGKKINHEGLLRYIVSYRNHNEFHEQCIERIFIDIMKNCQPETLTVDGRYTRRGGLDINPYRSTKKINFALIKNERLWRQ
jgi:7-cyano-7-deazaguanine reductase